MFLFTNLFLAHGVLIVFIHCYMYICWFVCLFVMFVFKLGFLYHCNSKLLDIEHDIIELIFNNFELISIRTTDSYSVLYVIYAKKCKYRIRTNQISRAKKKKLCALKKKKKVNALKSLQISRAKKSKISKQLFIGPYSVYGPYSVLTLMDKL